MIKETEDYKTGSFTFSLVTQGKYRFYSLTMFSDILARTCFVSTRNEDPREGFQRVLDKSRAEQIASYIDNGEASIPSAIVLSAQPEAELTIKPGGRALTFRQHPKAFLILDGQHRVYGFSLAKSHLRVPVIIFNGLTRREETRLFIDINTKQRPVPNELLLDIKHLADIETSEETILRDVFDMFNAEPESVLRGLLSPNEKARGKLSRVSFNAGIKPILPLLAGRDAEELFSILNGYVTAFAAGLEDLRYRELLITPLGFKGIMAFFPEVASRVKDRFRSEYTSDNFADVLNDVFRNVTKQQLSSAKGSHKPIHEALSKALSKSFSL
ncbi:DGQHR domain-containing protein [Microvirga calopogonii]|uniref:DGQHR domain-containing protein n=1 Tax=Microvirga calopogonii TaxID=2078013 RepID=UPI000E0D670B|nr:DGQHR domain-containing protein [Microvirga calopogonii]